MLPIFVYVRCRKRTNRCCCLQPHYWAARSTPANRAFCLPSLKKRKAPPLRWSDAFPRDRGALDGAGTWAPSSSPVAPILVTNTDRVHAPVSQLRCATRNSSSATPCTAPRRGPTFLFPQEARERRLWLGSLTQIYRNLSRARSGHLLCVLGLQLGPNL